MTKKQFCQSCSMPLDGENSGTEKDGSASRKYCELCYRNGEFLDPDLTLDDMKKVVDRVLEEKGWGAVRRWFAKMNLPRLERWKTK